MVKRRALPHNFHTNLQKHLDVRIDTAHGQRPLSFLEIAKRMNVPLGHVTRAHNLNSEENRRRTQEILSVKRKSSAQHFKKDSRIINILRDLVQREVGYDYHRMENSRGHTIRELQKILKDTHNILISTEKLVQILDSNNLSNPKMRKNNARLMISNDNVILTHGEKALLLKFVTSEKNSSHVIVDKINVALKNEFIEHLKQKGYLDSQINSELKRLAIRRYNYFLSLGHTPEKAKTLLKTNSFTNVTRSMVDKKYRQLGIKRFKPRKKINAFSDDEKKEILSKNEHIIRQVIQKHTKDRSLSNIDDLFQSLWERLFNVLDYYDESRSKDLKSYLQNNARFELFKIFRKRRNDSKMISYEGATNEGSDLYSSRITKATSISAFFDKIDFGDIDRIYERALKSHSFTQANQETLETIRSMIKGNYTDFNIKNIRLELKRRGINISRQAVELRMNNLREKLVKYKYI